MLVINPTTKAKHLNKEQALHQKKSMLKTDMVTQFLVSSGCLLMFAPVFLCLHFHMMQKGLLNNIIMMTIKTTPPVMLDATQSTMSAHLPPPVCMEHIS